jgi:AAA+ superfamily predicted ATPase
MNKGWFKHEEVGKTYYDWYAQRKLKYKPILPDGQRATPTEMCKFRNENPEWETDSDCNELCASIAYQEQDTQLQDQRVILPDGTYNCKSEHGFSKPSELHPMTLREETLIHRREFDIICSDIQRFIDNKELYERQGLHYKRGYLLFGAPGEGKTTIIRQLIQSGPLSKAIVIFTKNIPETELLNNLTKYDNDRLKVFVFEELTATVSGNSDLRDTLNFLDGEFSLNSMITIATTNYPEDLPGNIISRPSRFDSLIEVGKPDTSEVSRLIEVFTGEVPSREEAEALSDISTAAVKEVCILSMVKEISLQRAREALDSRLVKAQRFKADGKIGF